MTRYRARLKTLGDDELLAEARRRLPDWLDYGEGRWALLEIWWVCRERGRALANRYLDLKAEMGQARRARHGLA